MFRKIILSLLILSLVLLMGTAVLAQENVELEKTAANIFSEALNDYNQKNYTLAEEKFNKLLENEDLDEDLKFSVLYYSTMTAVQRNQTVKAIDSLEEMKELGFQSGNLNWRIGELFLNKNNQFDSASFEDAVKYLERAEELGVDNLAFKRDLAYAYFENQEPETAAGIYKEIIAADAEAEDYLNLAKIKENNNELTEAVKYYEAALDLNSSESSLYLNLGNLYQRLNDYRSAASIYNQGIKSRDNFAPYYIGLAESYIELGDQNEARKALKTAVEINKNSYYGYYLLGNIESEKKNYNQALEYYSQSLKYNQDYVQAYLAEGKVYLEREEYYRAISRFSLAVEKNPDYAESRYYLALAYYNSEMLEAARAEVRRAVHINSDYQQARKLLDQIEAELKIN